MYNLFFAAGGCTVASKLNLPIGDYAHRSGSHSRSFQDIFSFHFLLSPPSVRSRVSCWPKCLTVGRMQSDWRFLRTKKPKDAYYKRAPRRCWQRRPWRRRWGRWPVKLRSLFVRTGIYTAGRLLSPRFYPKKIDPAGISYDRTFA